MVEKILIIDDDLDTLRLVEIMLQKQGYQIVAANNGEEGLLKMSQEPPDLILLDVMMPGMDGYEVARRLRTNPKTVEIPVLMFTAKSQIEDKIEGIRSGVDGYLTKPVHPSELHTHVRELLSRSVKTETDQTVPKDHRMTTLLKAKRARTIGIISDRFSDWFINPPSSESEE